MANRYAVASGNWSNPAIWDGGTLPTSADDVRANGFTVTIDISVTVLSIRTVALAPAVAGGIFYIADGVTLTGDVWSGNNTGHGLQFNLPSGQSATIIGNVNAGGNAGNGIQMIGAGTLNVVGNSTSSSNTAGISIAAGAANCTLNFTGSTFPSNIPAINATVICTINFTGNLTGGSQNAGMSLATGCVANVNGNITASNVAGLSSTFACTIIANGVITSSALQSAITSSNVNGLVTVSGELINNGGVQAVYAQRLFLGDSATTWRFVKPDLTERMLYTADVLPNVPSQPDVRLGTTYGPSSELTGTLAVPPVSAVGVGVPVDNTVGTAELTADDILTAIELSANPIAERLRNVSTVQTTGGQITAFSS
jgi:hypothetical protein